MDHEHPEGLHVTDAGVEFIKACEGYREKPYRNFEGEPWTAGYGHTGPEVKPGVLITRETAERWLWQDLVKFEAAVKAAVKMPLARNHFDALVSLAYNIGGRAFENSTLVRRLNANDFDGAADEFLKWRKAGGHVVPALEKRRAAERFMFNTGEYDLEPYDDVLQGKPMPQPEKPATEPREDINSSRTIRNNGLSSVSAAVTAAAATLTQLAELPAWILIASVILGAGSIWFFNGRSSRARIDDWREGFR